MIIMKNLREYEKPIMSSVAVQSNKSVAAMCWGENHGSHAGTYHYYDSTGHGFVKFYVTATNCKEWDGDTSASAVYTCQYNEQGLECEQMTPENENAALSEFFEAFRIRFEQIGNGGSSYDGFSNDYPYDPHGMS